MTADRTYDVLNVKLLFFMRAIAMRKKDGSKKDLILDYIHEHYSRYGRAPVVLEIVDGTGLSSAPFIAIW